MQLCLISWHLSQVSCPSTRVSPSAAQPRHKPLPIQGSQIPAPNNGSYFLGARNTSWQYQRDDTTAQVIWADGHHDMRSAGSSSQRTWHSDLFKVLFVFRKQGWRVTDLHLVFPVHHLFSSVIILLTGLKKHIISQPDSSYHYAPLMDSLVGWVALR